MNRQSKTIDLERITALVNAARADGREVLLETEGLKILEALGFSLPYHERIPSAGEIETLDLSRFPGDQVVIKAVSPAILHKSEVGAVAVVPKNTQAIAEAIRKMEGSLVGRDLRGFIVIEYVLYNRTLGGELLFGIRWTDDFGPVVTYGAGGIYTEFLADNFRPGRDVAIAVPSGLEAGEAERLLEGVAITRLITGRLRGQAARIASSELAAAYMRFAELARAAVPELLSEIEVNPFVVHGGRLIALDVLARCEGRVRAEAVPRPLHKLKCLLEPRSLAIIGVSDRMNPGHVALQNIIRGGFDRDRICVIKPDSDSIEGCTCYPDVIALPGRVDLFVVSVSASQAPELVTTIIEEKKAESIILIPGGLGEKEGSEPLVVEMRSALDRARQSEWEGPLINGGNCMGVRSRPGKYDSTFIPEYKLQVDRDRSFPIAFISQSGAYLAAKTNKLGIDPRYAISVGNQMDLTIGDYLQYLKDDREVEVFAVYTEGFQPLDGLRFLEAAREIRASGRTVLFYRGGRTPAGAQASASHTAVVAGDYTVNRELARNAGVLVCETIDEFEDLLRLFAFLGSQPITGLRLGAVSNAGFESVAIADRIERFRLATFSDRTRARLEKILVKSQLARIVDIRNPMDITPMADDAVYEEAVRAILEDEGVDVAIVGCVPLTPALHTLSTDPLVHAEDVDRPDSIVRRLIRLKDEFSKPWVAAVDGGRAFDAMAEMLEVNGIPTFRTVDRALRMFGRFCEARIETDAAARNRTVEAQS